MLNSKKPLGRHLVWDLFGCSAALLDDVSRLEEIALRAARDSGATVLGHQSHKFEPQGVSVLVAVAESHLALHTWPENGYVAIDYFTCGNTVDPNHIIAVFESELQPSTSERQELARGALPRHELRTQRTLIDS